MLIDSHCHLDDKRYDLDRKLVIERAKKAQIDKMITIGCDVENSRQALEIAKDEPGIYFSAGIHPHEAGKAAVDAVSEIEKIASAKKCVAIGECGLDYYYLNSAKDKQRAIFTDQILLAKKLNKPLVVHVRDAFDDCFELFQKHRDPDQPTVIHCFTGTLEHAKTFLGMGAILSISGIVTFKKAGDLPEVVKSTPLEKLLVETDSPYLAPLPHRGKRNEPSYVQLVAEKVAELKKLPFHEVAFQTTKNATAFFGLS
jgi:TatD DNase family protein